MTALVTSLSRICASLSSSSIPAKFRRSSKRFMKKRKARLSVEALEDRQMLSATVPTPHEALVTAMYQDVLSRQPDAGGLAGGTQALDQGVSPAAVASALTHSDEYFSN